MAPLAARLCFPVVLGELLLGVVDEAMFAMIVIMVTVTTPIPPPMPTWLLRCSELAEDLYPDKNI